MKKAEKLHHTFFHHSFLNGNISIIKYSNLKNRAISSPIWNWMIISWRQHLLGISFFLSSKFSL